MQALFDPENMWQFKGEDNLFSGGNTFVSKSNDSWTNAVDTGGFTSQPPQTFTPAPTPDPVVTTPQPAAQNTQNGSSSGQTQGGGFAGTIPAIPDSNPAANVWGGYTAPAQTAPSQVAATTPATTTTTAAPAAGSNFANYVNSNPDLLGYWNANQGKPGAFDYWGLGSGATIDQFGQAQWNQNGIGENRPVTPTGPATPAVSTPAGPTKEEQANALVDKIKALYEGVSGLGYGTSLNDLKLKQTERDNLLKELDGIGVSSASALGKTYGGFIDTKYNDIASNQQASSKYFTDFLSNFGGDAWAQAKNLGLGSNFQLLIDKLDAADNDFTKYSWDGARLSEATAARDKLLATLNEQIGAQKTEKDKNAAWEQGVNQRLDQLVSELDRMDVLGFDTNSAAYRQKIRDIENEMRGYTSPLSVDLNDEIRKLTSASSAFSGLQTKRDTEVQMLRDTLAKYSGQGDALMSAISGASLYDGSALEQLAAQFEALKRGAAGVSSPLVAKYGNVNLAAQFQDLEQRLAAMKSQRQTLLGREQSKLDDIRTRLGNVADHDEDSMVFLANLLSGQSQSLARFTGSDLASITGVLDELSRGLQDKRGALTTKRSTIEQELGALLDQTRGTKYATLDDVGAARTALNGKMSDVRKYDATQAQDELDALIQLLNGEESRINADLKASQARDAEQAKATQAQVNRWGNLTGGGAANDDVMSAEGIATLMRRRQLAAGLAPYATPAYSSFSLALGL